VVKIEALSEERDTAVTFFRTQGAKAARLSLKVYHQGAPIPLSARVPLLENMGFKVINERTYRITPTGRTLSYLHEMTLEASRGGEIDLTADLKERLERLFMAVWQNRAENDGYNGLVLSADLAWRDIAVVRALSKYLRQAGVRFSEDYMWTTLNNYPEIASKLVDLFHLRFNPGTDGEDRTLGTARLESEINNALEEVSSLDDDRILRRFQNVIDSVLRTNFYQLDPEGEPKPTFAFKVDSRKITICRNRARSGKSSSTAREWKACICASASCPRRPALVRPAAGFPHRSARPGQGAAGQERGDRAGWRQGRLRAQTDAAESATATPWFKEGTESYKTFINAAARRHRQSRRRQGCAAGRVVRA
jgi:glutamate dehydrogenase